MRLIMRIIGTWSLGLAFVLLVIDGTRMMSASAFVATPLGESWQMLNAQSFADASAAIEGWLGPIGLLALWQGLMATPGWIVFSVLGLVLLIAFRRTGHKRFVERF